MVLAVAEANSARDKAPHLLALRGRLDELLLLLRLAKEAKAFRSFAAYTHAVEQVASVCRQNEGWLKSVSGPAPGAGAGGQNSGAAGSRPPRRKRAQRNHHCDDFVLIDRDPETLRAWRAAIARFPADELLLALNARREHLRPVSVRAIGGLVHRVHHHHPVVRGAGGEGPGWGRKPDRLRFGEARQIGGCGKIRKRVPEGRSRSVAGCDMTPCLPVDVKCSCVCRSTAASVGKEPARQLIRVEAVFLASGAA